MHYSLLMVMAIQRASSLIRGLISHIASYHLMCLFKREGLRRFEMVVYWHARPASLIV
jgi:hypothetical protein